MIQNLDFICEQICVYLGGGAGDMDGDYKGILLLQMVFRTTWVAHHPLKLCGQGVWSHPLPDSDALLSYVQTHII